MARKGRDSRGRGKPKGMVGMGAGLLIFGGGVLIYALSKMGGGGEAGLTGSFSVRGRDPIAPSGVEGIVIGGSEFQSADITFSGKLANGGNAPLPAGALFGMNVRSDGVEIGSQSLPPLPEIPSGGTIDVEVAVAISGLDRAGTVTALVGVIQNAVLLASKQSGVLAVIEAEAVIDLTGGFTATGNQT